MILEANFAVFQRFEIPEERAVEYTLVTWIRVH